MEEKGDYLLFKSLKESQGVLSFEAVHESVIYIWEEIFLFLVTKGNLILLFFTRSKFN